MTIFFIHELTRAVWDRIFSLFSVYWVLSSTVKEVFFSWQGSFVWKTRLKVWQAAPLCLFLDDVV